MTDLRTMLELQIALRAEGIRDPDDAYRVAVERGWIVESTNGWAISDEGRAEVEK